MNTRLPTTLLIAALLSSIGLIVWMYCGGLMSYTPALSANEVQNIYLMRIALYGLASILLQIWVIVLLIKQNTR